MHKIPKPMYEDCEEIERRIEALTMEAAKLPPGMARQSILVEVAKYRAYADVKRWVTRGPTAGPTS